MKVLYEEGQTSHLGPESCDHNGNGVVEALTGGAASRDIEPRKASSRSGCLRSRLIRGATPVGPLKVRDDWTLRGRRTRARAQTFYAGIARSWCWPSGDGCSVRGENLMGASHR